MGSAYQESLLLGGSKPLKKLWMRRIRVIFSSKKPINGKCMQLVIGDNAGDNFDIKIRGHKYLALTKDYGTITIHNMEYDTLAQIMAAELFKIEIQVGYASDDNLFTVMKGEVSYISQKPMSKHDTETYISYASEFIAAWSQSRINFCCNSGVNLYSMINQLFIESGATNMNISKDLKKTVLENIYSNYGTAANIISDALSMTGSTYSVLTDTSNTQTVISTLDLAEKRVIQISPSQLNIAGGHPTLTSNGLSISLFPFMNFIPGDILQIDNAAIDLSSGTNNAENISNSYNFNYLDADGCYIIQEVEYSFENRGSNFLFNCRAYGLTRFKNITGIS